MDEKWHNAHWRKSVLSDSGGCVEIAFADGTVGVRDTKAQGNGPILEFNEREWRAFTGGVALGEFEYDKLRTT
ncbi:DUF397 domain-containing protein [Phycicoccus sp. Soil803]|uniref:DUF397 domain-containing protein n=1 Tax=Phycicoccus sp. Soil803 TaxID=1736415 RepID=UPI000710E406|nr:DUF397 domain-containing protein [Phycicoccus sp. Soil803]KRF23651.1 regulator [Phycicoccus sp. Soil803]